MRDEHKIILTTVIVIVSIWVIDSALNSFVLHEGTFFNLLLNTREPVLRILLTLSFLAFGVMTAILAARHGRTELVIQQHTAAIETSMDGIALCDQEGRYVYVNQAFATINGYSDAEELIGKTYKGAYGEQGFEPMEQIFPALQKNKRWRGELVAKRKDGSTYFQEASMTMLADGGLVFIIRDVTWRKRHEEWLRSSERFLNTIFDSIRDPFCIFDGDYRIIRANEAYARLKNKTVEDLIGAKCYESLHNTLCVCEGCVVEKTFRSAGPGVHDRLVTLHDGTERWLEIYTYPILDDAGSMTHVIEYIRDVTERRRSEEEKRRLIDKLEQASRTDMLTGLLNRRALTETLLYEIDRSKRYGSELSLILCDIDKFKEINDTYGHDAGDRALQIIAAALKTIPRKSDVAGRHGGDEFMLILPETTHKGAEGLAENLLVAARDTELWSRSGKSVRITLSIGVATLKRDTDRIDSFIKRADEAMYLSKQSGRNRVSSVKS